MRIRGSLHRKGKGGFPFLSVARHRRIHGSLLGLPFPEKEHTFQGSYKPSRNLGDCAFRIADWLVEKNPPFAIRNAEVFGCILTTSLGLSASRNRKEESLPLTNERISTKQKPLLARRSSNSRRVMNSTVSVPRRLLSWPRAGHSAF